MRLQRVHPLGLVWLDELGDLFQPEFYESMALSLQSGVRHKQAFLLREMLYYFSAHPVIWPSTASSACPPGTTIPSSGSQQLQKVWVLQLPAGSSAQLPDMSSLGRLMDTSQWESSQRGGTEESEHAPLSLQPWHLSHLLICALTFHSITPALLQLSGSPGLEELRLPCTRHGANPTRTGILQHRGRALLLTLAMQPPPQMGCCAARAQDELSQSKPPGTFHGVKHTHSPLCLSNLLLQKANKEALL